MSAFDWYERRLFKRMDEHAQRINEKLDIIYSCVETGDATAVQKAEQYDRLVEVIHDYWTTLENCTAVEAVEKLMEEWYVNNAYRQSIRRTRDG